MYTTHKNGILNKWCAPQVTSLKGQFKTACYYITMLRIESIVGMTINF